MLRGLKARYAQHHGVHMLDSAIQTAVRLSRRYLTGRQLPDKAVDLLDTAGARVRMSLDTLPEPLTQLQARLTALDIEREAIEQDSVFYPEASPERLAELTDLRDELQAEAGHLEAQYQQEKALAQQIMTLRQEGTDSTELQQQLRAHQGFAPLLALDVDARAVATVVADWTGIPLSSLLKDEQSDLLSMEQSLENRVVGQSPALCAIAQRLRAAKTGLTPENGPQGVFLLTGPSGTVKTETALTLADTLFGGEKSLITINLSEYQEPHTVSQLKGSPPGYVGYGQGGVLTEAVRKRPYSVVLLDEVEKAYRDVMNLFYQVFDRGFMRDGEGREIDFRNTVILMTANLGSDHIMQLLEEKPDATDADLHELLYGRDAITEAVMGIQNFDHSHHKLKIRGQQSPVDVLTFEGREQLSTPFRYDIQFTSTDKAITPELVLMQDGAFSLTAPPVPDYKEMISGGSTKNVVVK